MSDTPKFEVIDRRKFKAEEEEHETAPAAAPEPPTPASTANAGVGVSSDLAAVLLTDNANATAQGADCLYDVITALGKKCGTAAATSGGFLADLLSLF